MPRRSCASAYLAANRTSLLAPVTGYVAQRSVQVGEQIAPGKPLLSIVPLSDVWVDANFKETELEHVRIGQPVTLTADLYGKAVTYQGRVEGLASGTGSAFSLLPPQNASGNWIKIVQRLPVRIQLDSKELEAHPLRIGLSMNVAGRYARPQRRDAGKGAGDASRSEDQHLRRHAGRR